MKVLYLIWDLGQGGSQVYLSNLIRVIEKQDLEISVIVLTGPGIYSATVGEHAKYISYVGFKNGFDIIGAMRLFYKIRSLKPDIIHLHSNSMIALTACVISNVPIIYTEHGVGVRKDCRRGGLNKELLYKVFYRWISFFVAVSEAMRTKMIAANPLIESRIVKISNGIDLTQLLCAKAAGEYPRQLQESGNYKIGVVARLTKVKGLDLFLQTAAEVRHQYRHVSFFIIGDGELRGELEAMAAELGVLDCVYFLGYRGDVLALIKEFDLYLMTSHFEAFGLTLVEAMGSGVPVVAAKAEGPFDEIIEHGVDGILVGNRNPRLIADAIIQLLKDEELRRNMGSAAQKKIALKYTMTSNASAIYNCYKSVSTTHASRKSA